MRELVYLSDRKLRQFMPDRPRRLVRGGWQVTTPVGGVGLDPEVPDAERERGERLRRIVRHVSAAAGWFAEPGLRAGSWVQFEAPLNFRALRGAAPGMVLFVDPPRGVEGYETGGAVRLLLHGSVEHLAGGRVPVVAEPPALSETVHHAGGWDCSGGDWVELLTTQASVLLGSLTSQPDATSEDEAQEPVSPVTLLEGTRQLLAALDRQLPVETAAWMRGYARVTAALECGDVRYVVATPLYVEYVAE
ncbi:SAVMC3_10250 family protein [Streptomyces flavofungini]|uniref:SAVMC3_10250 family protein n=1 Tax=Streptomyces flavofungini TaxID=68200 RepID=UPI0025B18A6F|nr:SAVMC3_10250 family protein [Streptomyces flavofungini]WJV49116.1 SAVMC3_10250 family protein [Streptomyces flavofungini]